MIRIVTMHQDQIDHMVPKPFILCPCNIILLVLRDPVSIIIFNQIFIIH